jgi:peptide/nickel transport system substrate-binding protein
MPQITRRRFLAGAAWLGAAVGLVEIAGCAQPPPSTAPPTSASAAKPAAPTTAPAAQAAAPTSAPAAKPAAPSGTPKRGGMLTLAIHEDLTSMDPHKLQGVGDILIQGLMAQPLVTGNAKDEIEPVLAESYKTDDGGKTWTFNLRQGVKFHNGKEMTAEEVKWSLDRVLNKDVGAILYTVLTPINLKTTVVDKYTVKMEISGGYGSFLSNLAQSTRAAILHPDSAGADGQVTVPIGTGPFQYVDRQPGVEFKAKRHESYWQKAADGQLLPYIDALTIKIAADASTRLNGLRSGEVEFITNPPLNEVQKWVDTKPPDGLGFKKWFYNYSDYLGLNSRRKPFDDVRLRQAVRYTLDRDALNQGMYFGLGEVHNQPFKTTSSWYLDVPTVKRDLAKAKQLMQDAGVGGGVDATMLVWSPLQDKLAEVSQAQLSEVGIRMKLDKRDPANFLKELPSYNWDIATLVIGTIFHPDRPYSYLDRTHLSHPNVGGYDNPEIENLLQQGRNEPDMAKAKAIYKTIVEKGIEEVGTPLYTTNLPVVDAWRDYVQGFDAFGYDLVSINAEMGLHKTWIAK